MSVLVSIQQQCADRILSDPFFANVPVLNERLKDLNTEIATALAPVTGAGGKSGLAIVVLTPTANVHFENVFGPFFDDIRITVRVLENVTVNQDPTNGTNIPAAAAAEEICSLLHYFQPDSANGPVVSRRPGISLQDDPTNLVYLCRFRTSGGPVGTLPQSAAPVAANNSGAITLTSATTGAAIFYTSDGSNPAPRNGVLYTAPFTPATGLTIKSRAWLAGYLASTTTTINT
jgi:hypothetical protein